ncbi:hypothetical protein AB0G74_03135 [Streptomyces sp. NPDC020875]|uniref:hypothetical protein n=1 Tax=Streptomyces sp. NPDC020875 TaxID=3154898 RepID=UPI0034031AD8
MSATPFPTVFARLNDLMTTRYADARWCYHQGSCPGPADACGLDLDRLRRTATDPSTTGGAALWGHVVGRARTEPTAPHEQRWTLLAVWLLAPRLAATSRKIARRIRAEHADVCSTMLLGLLEALRGPTPDHPADTAEHLLRAASTTGWRTPRRDPRERLADHPEDIRGNRSLDDPETPCRHAGIVEISAPSQALVRRANGERLGALAHHLGLMPRVRAVRRTRRARPLPPSRPDHQIGLFGVAGPPRPEDDRR